MSILACYLILWSLCFSNDLWFLTASLSIHNCLRIACCLFWQCPPGWEERNFQSSCFLPFINKMGKWDSDFLSGLFLLFFLIFDLLGLFTGWSLSLASSRFQLLPPPGIEILVMVPTLLDILFHRLTEKWFASLNLIVPLVCFWENPCIHFIFKYIFQYFYDLTKEKWL